MKDEGAINSWQIHFADDAQGPSPLQDIHLASMSTNTKASLKVLKKIHDRNQKIAEKSISNEEWLEHIHRSIQGQELATKCMEKKSCFGVLGFSDWDLFRMGPVEVDTHGKNLAVENLKNSRMASRMVILSKLRMRCVTSNMSYPGQFMSSDSVSDLPSCLKKCSDRI